MHRCQQIRVFLKKLIVPFLSALLRIKEEKLWPKVHHLISLADRLFILYRCFINQGLELSAIPKKLCDFFSFSAIHHLVRAVVTFFKRWQTSTLGGTLFKCKTAPMYSRWNAALFIAGRLANYSGGSVRQFARVHLFFATDSAEMIKFSDASGVHLF